MRKGHLIDWLHHSQETSFALDSVSGKTGHAIAGYSGLAYVIVIVSYEADIIYEEDYYIPSKAISSSSNLISVGEITVIVPSTLSSVEKIY